MLGASVSCRTSPGGGLAAQGGDGNPHMLPPNGCVPDCCWSLERMLCCSEVGIRVLFDVDAVQIVSKVRRKKKMSWKSIAGAGRVL